jgi:hypothetical protein
MVDNIKSDLKGIGWDGMEWIDLVQNTDHLPVLMNAVMNIQVP